MHKSRITLFLHNWILVCASIGLSLTAQADTVLLTNGDRISGDIIELTASAIKIKTTYAGTLSLDTLAVKSFDTDNPQHWQINLKPHQTRIHSSDKNGHVSIGDKIYAIDELSLSPSQARWKKSGLLEVSLDVDNDVNRKEKLHINSELNLESKHWRNELKAEVKRDKEKDRTTEDTSELNYTLDYLIAIG